VKLMDYGVGVVDQPRIILEVEVDDPVRRDARWDFAEVRHGRLRDLSLDDPCPERVLEQASGLVNLHPRACSACYAARNSSSASSFAPVWPDALTRVRGVEGVREQYIPQATAIMKAAKPQMTRTRKAMLGVFITSLRHFPDHAGRARRRP
jgi:hypothetical protein